MINKMHCCCWRIIMANVKQINRNIINSIPLPSSLHAFRKYYKTNNIRFVCFSLYSVRDQERHIRQTLYDYQRFFPSPSLSCYSTPFEDKYNTKTNNIKFVCFDLCFITDWERHTVGPIMITRVCFPFRLSLAAQFLLKTIQK